MHHFMFLKTFETLRTDIRISNITDSFLPLQKAPAVAAVEEDWTGSWISPLGTSVKKSGHSLASPM